MRTACFIPIKSNSERVPGKNFRPLYGKKLYEYILMHVQQADVFDDIFVDTNSEEVAAFARKLNYRIIQRKPELATNQANGNDLLTYHAQMYPDYDYYCQAFATAPFLSGTTIRGCMDTLTSSALYDSCFTAIERRGFFWMNDMALNYRPDILPRSQDLRPIIEETTGLYAITKASLEHYKCRIGASPYIYLVDDIEATDINTEKDLAFAEMIAQKYLAENG